MPIVPIMTAATPVAAQKLAQTARTAEDFEAMFATQMLAPMWENIETGGMFGGGSGEEMFRNLLLQEYGKIVAAGGSLGLSAPIKQEMLKLQEAQS